MNKLEIAPAGDLAYAIYRYQLKLQGRSGKPIVDRGKDLVVWKKQPDRSWKVVAESFNSDLPSATPTKSRATAHCTAKSRSTRRKKRR